MLADPQALTWLKPGVANVDSEFPNPYYGIETEQDQAAWGGLSLAGRCAMRWRGSVRAMARLRTSMSGEQLTTLRYEDLIKHPAPTGAAVARFIGSSLAPLHAPHIRRPGPPGPEACSLRQLPTTAPPSEHTPGAA